MIIGLDDTDSRDGMCTTYLMAVLVEKINAFASLKDYPLLVRLNPNIKYKTRGNAALAINIALNDKNNAAKVKELVIDTVEKMSVLSDENTNPGIVFIEIPDESMKNDISKFSLRAVRDVLEIREAKELLEQHDIDHRGFKNERGLIGALAAAGFALCGLSDHTFELIAYREKKNWGSPRIIDEGSVWAANAATYPDTWDTVDIENERIVFAPHSLDPILFGIRGKNEESVRRAFSMIGSEPIERHIVYRTNQNTDMHLIPAKIHEVQEDRSYILDGVVSKAPKTIIGGHIIFEISENGSSIECVAFEPTKGFRRIIRELREGDEVIVYGSVKDKTVNLEKIRIDRLNIQVLRNPVCCGKRMKSMGKGQGKRCEKCGAVSKEQVVEAVFRGISIGLYEVPPCARRHLAKPLIRFSYP
ncbi:MAG: tRNA(Ile)(2)-agmatinylcytidine synthase [Candidatus Methanoperedens sp.]|nr:tRNA(Ile)(2)-agmatinylcytidine synthase [Candidatus Methanoperedens sp.]